MPMPPSVRLFARPFQSGATPVGNRRKANRQNMNQRLFLILCAVGSITAMLGGSAMGSDPREKILLNHVAIVTGPSEHSYIQYGAQDLANYLKEITGGATRVTTSPDPRAESSIVVGKMVESVLPGVLDGTD